MTNEELSDLLLDLRVRYASQDKKLMSHQFDLEAFTRKQDATNKRIEDRLAILVEASLERKRNPPDPDARGPKPRRWKLPPSVVTPPAGADTEPLPKVKPEAPRFNGENATEWIRKIQRYYNHHFTPLEDRIYLTSYLFDHPASSWLTYWEDNCKHKNWDDFLLAVKHRFDPDLYVDHVGCLATLRQTTTVDAYQTEFEDIMQKTCNVTEETLMSLFIAGLKEPIKQQLLTKGPTSLNETFALAKQFTACLKLTTAATQPSRAAWSDRDSRQRQNSAPALTTVVPPRATQAGQPRPDIPVVRISAAERADRTRKGLCWYCPEKYSREHVCGTKFYALIGADDEDDLLETETD